MNNILFEIRNLKCAYVKNHKVLEIDHLDIPAGKIVVIIGKSGAGKSTILETLGLMNNTILDSSVVKFNPGLGDIIYQFEEIWKNKNEDALYHIRRKHFSFIFQDTNLMPNFTAYENVCIAQMIQGKSRKEAMKNTEIVMKLVGLGEVDRKKKAFELSGGQKQRLAFVRAITPEFTVLFGDEPTGNLDESNSRELMSILKNNIIKNNRSAIIVSHNIDLSLEFADQIIIITKTDSCGNLDCENIFSSDIFETRKIWKNSNNEIIENMTKTIKNLL